MGQGGSCPNDNGLVSEKSTNLERTLHLRGRVNNISGKEIKSAGECNWRCLGVMKAPV